MAEQPKVLILTYQSTDYVREQIERTAEILGCKTPFEVTSFWQWRDRWSAYDWDSPGFRNAILKRYRKICVWGSTSKEDRELLERIRPFYTKQK